MDEEIDKHDFERAQAHDLYEAFAQQVDREDSLINARMQWMLSSTTFLFAALGLLVSGRLGGDGGTTEPAPVVAILLIAIPLVGAALAFFADGAIAGALRQLTQLKLRWESEAMRPDQRLARHHPRLCDYPRPFGDPDAHRPSVHYARAIPLTILLAWLVVLVASVAQRAVWAGLIVALVAIGVAGYATRRGRRIATVIAWTRMPDDLLASSAGSGSSLSTDNYFFAEYGYTLEYPYLEGTFGMRERCTGDRWRSKQRELVGWSSPKDGRLVISGWFRLDTEYELVRLLKNGSVHVVLQFSEFAPPNRPLADFRAIQTSESQQ